MRGRKPRAYELSEADRQYLQAILADGQLVQRVGHRAQALLALDRGERLQEIVHWLGWSRMGLWYLWRRYQQYGVDAIFDAERSGRPPVFSPAAARAHRAYRVH
jgi:Helix-turn-helix domain